jgi:MCP family monocarboxylic acid transporter-like MFS transporter 10
MHTHFFLSWIGSFQLFLLYAPGVFVGKAFDAGYLYAYSYALSALIPALSCISVTIS